MEHEITTTLRVERFVIRCGDDPTGPSITVHGEIEPAYTYATRWTFTATGAGLIDDGETWSRDLATHDLAIEHAQQTAGRLMAAWLPVAEPMTAFEDVVNELHGSRNAD